MPDGAFQVAVVTPEARLLEMPAKALVLRSSDGFLTVLDGHTPIVTDVVPCDVRVDPEEGDPLHLAVHGGYLQVETGELDSPHPEGAGPAERSTRATLLAGVAELAADIDVARAESAKEAAEARADELRAAGARKPGEGDDGDQEVTPEGLELAESEAAVARASLRLEVAEAR